MEFSKPGSIAAERGRAGVGAAYSALAGWSASRTVPRRLRGVFYRAFARAVGANLDEVELPLEDYPSLGDFFARRLRPGARELDPWPGTIVSPCDGVVAARGISENGALVQAKGRLYELAALVADAALASALTGGAYTTIYLSPRDYHRVHAPVDATVLGYDYIPGALWPVNPRLAGRRDSLLARNERVVFHLRVAGRTAGSLALVMVGASGVGNIRLAPAITPAGAPPEGFDSADWRSAGEIRRVSLAPGVEVRRGDELAAFRLGSTVVLAFSPRIAELTGELGDAVRFGQSIGRRPDASGGAA